MQTTASGRENHLKYKESTLISHILAFREKLAKGQLCLGTGITLSDPAVVEALAPEVDFLWIDLEHNPINIESLLRLLIAARAGGAATLVRLPSSDPALLKRVLDTGAEGIIIPQVRSADEVRKVVDTTRYKPLGNRGWGPRRPSDYGRRSMEQIVHEANEQLFLAVQIENTDAIADLDEIIKVPGIDCLVVGPHDLALSMGVGGQLDDSNYLATIRTIIQKGHEAGLSIGFGDEAQAECAQRWVEMGADWIQPGSDFGYMIKTANQLFADIRKAASK
ncbi:MAG: hypothetical protein CMJ72_12765 [Planctomycetaceae bacterium]|nr:hypothetical protein [Planctomycetaceae bacterium]HCK40908.1 hypothetical protein [Planctomycetaceae bacterium]